MYAEGLAVDENFDKAFALASKAVAQGGSFGQSVLGYLYTHGLGVKKDLIEGYKWLVLSEESGDLTPEAASLKKELSLVLTPAQIAEGMKRANAETKKQPQQSQADPEAR